MCDGGCARGISAIILGNYVIKTEWKEGGEGVVSFRFSISKLFFLQTFQK